jgi:PhnB protein
MEGQETKEEDRDKIMHVSLPISKETILMGSDAGCDHAAHLVMGNNFSISINAESREEADKLFAGLSAGGNHADVRYILGSLLRNVCRSIRDQLDGKL